VLKLVQEASQLEHFGRALVALGIVREDLVVLDPDVAASTKTTYFAERFPRRFIEIGISEQDMIGVAAGLAASGKTPVACGFAVFVACRVWEQIANSVARPGLNVKIVGTHSGLSASADGASHQTIGDIALMRVLPGMRVVVPADAAEAVKALESVVEASGPAYLRLMRGSTPVVYDEGCDFEIGRANLLREGSDATIVANGVMVGMALEAAERLARYGVSAKVLDMHTVKPLDVSAVSEAARETGAIVTAEEHSVIGGLGGAVAEAIVCDSPTPMTMVGVKDRFGGSSRSHKELLASLRLTPDAIVRAVQSTMEKRK
jgi:transketolase